MSRMATPVRGRVFRARHAAHRTARGFYMAPMAPTVAEVGKQAHDRHAAVWDRLYRLGLDRRECDRAADHIVLGAMGHLWEAVRTVVMADGLPFEHDIEQEVVPLAARLEREIRVRNFLAEHGALTKMLRKAPVRR